MSDFVERWAAGWSAPSPDRVAATAATDITIRWPGEPEPTHGIEAWAARVAGIVERLPDLTLTPTAHAEHGDTVFISWRASATIGGKPAEWEGVDRLRLVDGKVADALVIFDRTALLPR